MPHSTSSRGPSPAWKLALSAGLAVVVFALLGLAVQPQDLHTSDFFSFWAGGRLVGAHLYDPLRAEAIQHEVSPLVQSKRYIRPPFYALAFWPLGRLPFRSAYIVWWIFNVAAVLLFVRVWQFTPQACLACAYFAPLLSSFLLGQDAAVMLLIVAGGALLVHSERDAAGGAVLSLCAIKPHLFLFIPIVLLAQRRYRALLAMSAGGVALYLLSTVILGWDWPVVFVRAALDNESSIKSRLLGVSGLAQRAGSPVWVLPIVSATGVGVVYWLARGRSWLFAIAFATAAGVVFGPRALIYYDASLLLPLLLLCVSAPLAIGAGAVLIFAPGIVAEVASCGLLFAAPALWRRRLAKAGCTPEGEPGITRN